MGGVGGGHNVASGADGMKSVARIFPRKTKASPTDELAFFGPPGMFPPDVDEVHISVAFTYDLDHADWLAQQWVHVADVKIGGPATGEAGGEFVPGQYLRKGYVITSRGCPNKCWFCSVWKREGTLRELPITEGWNVLDDNLLACSRDHVERVFSMLECQNGVEFTGGLEAARLEWWHVERLSEVKPKQVFFAYDTHDDLEPLWVAGEMFKKAGWKSHQRLRCYVLIGHPKDTIDKAEIRLKQAAQAGFMPMAMLWRNKAGETSIPWRRFQRSWARPAMMRRKLKTIAR